MGKQNAENARNFAPFFQLSHHLTDESFGQNGWGDGEIKTSELPIIEMSKAETKTLIFRLFPLGVKSNFFSGVCSKIRPR